MSNQKFNTNVFLILVVLIHGVVPFTFAALMGYPGAGTFYQAFKQYFLISLLFMGVIIYIPLIWRWVGKKK